MLVNVVVVGTRRRSHVPVLGLVLIGESGVKASSLKHESLVLGHFAVYRWSMEVARSGIRWKLWMRDVSEMVGASPGAS